jgi:ABC-2 type transport system permease protein
MMQHARATMVVMRRDLGQLFGTPLLWVLMGVFFIATGMVYLSLLLGFIDDAVREEYEISINITIGVIEPICWTIHFFLLVQVPLLTMRTIAEERRMGTMNLLRTLPVGDWPVIIGKWLANSIALLVYLSITLVFPIITAILSDPEWPVIIASYIALAMVTFSYTALGVFYSSLSESQVVAAVLTFVTLFAMLVFSQLADAFGSADLSLLANHLTFMAQLEGFFKGNIASENIVYFVLFTSLFLFFGVRQMESLRWRA